MDKHEENYQDNFDNGYENFFQESKKSIVLGLYQDKYLLIRKIPVFFQNDEQHFSATFPYTNFMNTFTTVKILLKHEKSCR